MVLFFLLIIHREAMQNIWVQTPRSGKALCDRSSIFSRYSARAILSKSEGTGKFPKRSNNAIISIPAESALFFQCFYELAVDKKYHAAFCSGKGTMFQNKYWHSFCATYVRRFLCGLRVMTKKKIHIIVMCYMKMRCFRQKLLPDLWHRNWSHASKSLKSCPRMPEQKTRLEALMDCILCLDRNINKSYAASQDREIGAKSNNKNLCASNNVAFSPSKIGIQNLLEVICFRESKQNQMIPHFRLLYIKSMTSFWRKKMILGHAHSWRVLSTSLSLSYDKAPNRVGKICPEDVSETPWGQKGTNRILK